MPTYLELFNQMKVDIAAGKCLTDEVHLVNHTQERKRRKENKSQTTRFTRETHSPHSWAELSGEWDRYMATAVDPSLGVLLVIRALKQFEEGMLRQWLTEGAEHEGDQPGPPKADIPEWLR